MVPWLLSFDTFRDINKNPVLLEDFSVHVVRHNNRNLAKYIKLHQGNAKI